MKLRATACAALVLCISACALGQTRAAVTPTPSPAPVLTPDFVSYVAAYRTGAGATYVVNGLGHLVNLNNGWIRQLFATPTADHFTVGPNFQSATPKEAGVTFDVVGASVDTMTITPESGAAVTARRLLVKQTDVRIPSTDGVVLAATITEPAVPGPHPAIVIVHGSEPGTRVLYGVWVGFYTSLGLTVLTYDKRGNGESTGSYPGELASEPALNKFADDAAACLRFLARWPGVDSRQVGFHGGSQGGWTVPLAIKRVPSAAFAVLLSGPAVSVGQQAAWSAASDDASHLPTDAPAAIDSMMRAAADVGYQPRPVLQALKIPVLWLNGETDRHVPTALNTEILRGMRKPNFYLQVLPGVSHGLLENPTGLDADDATSQRLARDLFMRMATWLAAHAGSSAMS